MGEFAYTTLDLVLSNKKKQSKPIQEFLKNENKTIEGFKLGADLQNKWRK